MNCLPLFADMHRRRINLRFWLNFIAVATPVEFRSTIYMVCPGGWTEIGTSALAGSYEQRVPVYE